MNNPEQDQLRQIVRNEELPTQQRRNAAAHLIDLIVANVQAPDDDHAEVQERMQPWPDRALAAIIGPAANGESLAAARKEVLNRRRLREVLTIITDDNASYLEKLEGCAWVLASYGHIRKWSLNNSNATILLAEVLPPDATKFAGVFKPHVTVRRPPVELKDVWRI